MKKRTTWLRISAVLTLLYAIGHTLGYPWTPVREGSAQQVVDAMKRVSFAVEGTSRTYWDFYQGFGWAITGFLAIQAVILWQLASFSRSRVAGVRVAIAAFLLAFIFNAVIVGRYFFVEPMIFVVALVVCLAVALIASPEPQAGSNAA